MKEEVLRLQRVTLKEKGADVLSDLDLHLMAGELLGLLFLDYQGRDALVELVCRNHPIPYGAVWFRENQVNSYQKSPLTENGVTVIDGKARLVDDMTVADNIFVLRGGFKKYILRPSVLNRQMAFFAAPASIHIDGGALVRNLSYYEKCVVQLLKAIIIGHRVVVLQDVSSFISTAELSLLHGLLHHFAGQGLACLYLCNHHEEIFSLCHRAMLFSNGRVLRNIPKRRFSTENLSMYGYPVGHFGPSSGSETSDDSDDSVLQFSAVHTGHLSGVSFSLSRGECLVLLDTGNTALREVFSLLKRQSAPLLGRVLLWRKPLRPGQKAQNGSIGLIAERPVESMLYPDFSYLDNLCFPAGEKMPKIWRCARFRRNIQREYQPLVGNDIFVQDIRGLSAASLYNLIYYSQYLRRPDLLVILQPFFGADLYLRTQILSLIDQIRKRGTAVLILDVNISDSPVVADRILVLENGRITQEFRGEDMKALNERKSL